jgi:oxygen-dependent protoporphyrinogen oxidase
VSLGGARVTVLEAGSRWGGQIYTERASGFVLEHGAEGYAAPNVAAREFCTAIGLAGRLVSQLTMKTLIMDGTTLAPAPPGRAAELAGIQADRADVGHGLTALRGGMGELTTTLVAFLKRRATLQLNQHVTHVTRQAQGWTVETATGATLTTDAVLIATPALAAAQLVEASCEAAAAALAALTTLSSLSVHLALPRSAVTHALDASGCVALGGVAAEGLRACTFVTSKFPGRAPRERVLLRAFFRPGASLSIDEPDERWVGLAVEALWRPLGVKGKPVDSWVARWPNAIARYDDDHAARMALVREALDDAAPGLTLAGAAYQSAGVSGAIESAEAAGQRLLAPRRSRAQRYGWEGNGVS